MKVAINSGYGGVGADAFTETILHHRKIKIDKRFKEITEEAKQYALDAMVK